jgi:hypothetical protein
MTRRPERTGWKMARYVPSPRLEIQTATWSSPGTASARSPAAELTTTISTGEIVPPPPLPPLPPPPPPPLARGLEEMRLPKRSQALMRSS